MEMVLAERMWGRARPGTGVVEAVAPGGDETHLRLKSKGDGGAMVISQSMRDRGRRDPFLVYRSENQSIHTDHSTV